MQKLSNYNNILFGTCSWKYDSWRDIIYRENGEINYLKEYSKYFKTVEIDQWFWSLFENKNVKLPSKKDVLNYRDSVIEDFIFTIKVPNSITLTHYYNKQKAERLKQNPYFLSQNLFNDFILSIKEIVPQVGVLILQFEYLNKQKMSSQLEFLTRLEKFLESISKDVSIGIETRNPNYLNKEFFKFLRDRNLVPVLLQGYYMPSVFDIYWKFRDYITNKIVIRLHGPYREKIESESGGNWNKIIHPKDEELIKLKELILDLTKRKIKGFVNVNNHYEGSAPLTIKRIISLLN